MKSYFSLQLHWLKRDKYYFSKFFPKKFFIVVQQVQNKQAAEIPSIVIFTFWVELHLHSYTDKLVTFFTDFWMSTFRFLILLEFDKASS